jgi:stage III sporulation protein AD
MELFIKAAAGALITMILYLILSKAGKEYAILLTIAAVFIIAGIVITFLEPVIDFIQKLISLGQFDSEMIRIIFRSVGIGLLAEIAGLICGDAGNASLGKILQTLASAVILWMSIPLFSGLLELVEKIMVAI